MYDPTPGRFTVPDPVGFQAGDPDLERYVGNDPTNATDPTGLQQVRRTSEVKQGNIISTGKITDLDAGYKDAPFKTLAVFLRGVVADTYKRLFKDWNITVPAEINQAGLFTFSNKAVKDKNRNIPAGAARAAFNVFFVRFDVFDPNAELGIRVMEYTTRTENGKSEGVKGPIVVTPEKGNAWVLATKKMPDGKFSQSIIYADVPGAPFIAKKFDSVENGENLTRHPSEVHRVQVQVVAVFNTKTNVVLAHKVVVTRMSVDQEGNVAPSFLPETAPEYKAIDADFRKKNYPSK